MEMLKSGLFGFITGIALLVAIVLIFRRQEDKRREREDRGE